MEVVNIDVIDVADVVSDVEVEDGDVEDTEDVDEATEVLDDESCDIRVSQVIFQNRPLKSTATLGPI